MTLKCTHILLAPLNTTPFRHVSAFKGPSSGRKTDTFQQQGHQYELPDVKFSTMDYQMQIFNKKFVTRSKFQQNELPYVKIQQHELPDVKFNKMSYPM
jgi:hypothetical protein